MSTKIDVSLAYTCAQCGSPLKVQLSYNVVVSCPVDEYDGRIYLPQVVSFETEGRQLTDVTVTGGYGSLACSNPQCGASPRRLGVEDRGYDSSTGRYKIGERLRWQGSKPAGVP